MVNFRLPLKQISFRQKYFAKTNCVPIRTLKNKQITKWQCFPEKEIKKFVNLR